MAVPPQHTGEAVGGGQWGPCLRLSTYSIQAATFDTSSRAVQDPAGTGKSGSRIHLHLQVKHTALSPPRVELEGQRSGQGACVCFNRLSKARPDQEGKRETTMMPPFLTHVGQLQIKLTNFKDDAHRGVQCEKENCALPSWCQKP